MAATRFTSVDEYIASHPGAVQRILERVRSSIRKSVPGAEESIAYNMPAYKLGKRPVVYFAAWKGHYSIYPFTDRVAAAFKKDLSRYTVEKGTIRFPFTEAVPAKLIEGIAKVRAQEVTRAEARPRQAKKR
jgi:uncharacterized protein YdhG (YjbR/CyaY superfamily)